MRSFLRWFSTATLLIAAMLASASVSAQAIGSFGYLSAYAVNGFGEGPTPYLEEGSHSVLSADLSASSGLGEARGAVSISSIEGVLRGNASGSSTFGNFGFNGWMRWDDFLLTSCFELPALCNATTAQLTIAVNGTAFAQKQEPPCENEEGGCSGAQAYARADVGAFTTFDSKSANFEAASAEGGPPVGGVSTVLTLTDQMSSEIYFGYELFMDGYADAQYLSSSSFDLDVSHTVGLAGYRFLDANGLDVTSRYNVSFMHGTQLIAAPVPEPGSYAMLIAGLALLGFAARRRKLKLAA